MASSGDSKLVSWDQEPILLQNEPVQYRPLPYVPYALPTFTSKSKYRKFQILKLLVGMVTLMPLRLILFVTSIGLASISATIACKNKPRTVYGHPADMKESNWANILTNRFVRLGLFALGLTSIEFKGKVPVDYDQDKPWLKYSVVAAPHSATFDWAMVVSRAMRLLSPVIKAEAGLAKGVAHIVRTTMPLVVKRDSPESRKEAVVDTNRRINEGPENGWFPVLCFPEGTNGNRKQILRFKAGPFIAGKPLIPVIIKYPHDESHNDNDLVTWAHFGRSVLTGILLHMCRLQTSIVYQFMDPYYPTEEESKNPALYAENVRQLMSKEAKLPTSDWTFEDAKLMRICQKHKFQPEIGAIKIAKVFSGIKSSEKHATELLNKYIECLKKYMPKRPENRVKGLLPVLERSIIIDEIICKRGESTDCKEQRNLFDEKLPSYISFEQLAVVYGKVLTQKIS